MNVRQTLVDGSVCLAQKASEDKQTPASFLPPSLWLKSALSGEAPNGNNMEPKLEPQVFAGQPVRLIFKENGNWNEVGGGKPIAHDAFGGSARSPANRRLSEL